MIDDDYIALCREEMEAIAEASQTLLTEMYRDFDTPAFEKWTEAQADRRRAELYKEHLDAAGIEIRRTGSRCDHLCCGDRCTRKSGHDGDHQYEES